MDMHWPWPATGIEGPNVLNSLKSLATSSSILYSAICVVGLLPATASTAFAQGNAAAFYQNKTITLVIGADPGGTYDVPGRLLARHLPHHIPGSPHLVVQNMPGAGGAIATNYIYSTAPQDGTVLLNLLNTIPLAQILGRVKVHADLTKLQWIGNMSRQAEVVLVWHTAPALTLEDARHKTLIMGATSSGAYTGMMPRILNRLLGTKFEVVTGYTFPGLDLAMERGEINGQAGAAWMPVGKYADLVRDGKLRVLLQGGFRDPSLKEVPLLEDLVEPNSPQAQLVALFSTPGTLGRPTAVGPGVPEERVELLRAAYQATMSDPAFLADAERIGVPIQPVSGAELDATVNHVVQMSPTARN
jgi:tripartite-type tricarboxylate transporter receptor subunit TctC